MENTSENIDRDAAAEQMAAVDAARNELAHDLVVPRGYDTTAGLSAGANVAAFGFVFGSDRAWHLAVGVVLFVLGAAGIGWSVRRFRDLNGAWVSGKRPGATFPTSVLGAVVQVGLIVATIAVSWSLGWWWFGLVLAPVEVAAFIVLSRRWMDVYRAEHGTA